MLIKFIPTGTTKKGRTGRTGGGQSAQDYLLGKDFEKGIVRDGATLLRGNPSQTTEIINSIKNQNAYKSGVISFAKEEKPTQEQLESVMDGLENTLFPNLDKDRYSCYWVHHQDKDRDELHFIIAEIDLQTNKSLAVYYAPNDKKLIESWAKLTIEQHGFIDPSDPNHKRSMTPTTRNEKDNATKDMVHERILSAVEQNPDIKSRDDVLEVIRSLGYEVTRDKQPESISIKNPQGNRNLKLKGDLYSKNFSRDKLPSQQKYAKLQYDKDHDNRIADYKKQYEYSLALREKRLLKRIGTVDRTAHNQELSAELDQIRATNEPNFLKKVAEYQREELKKIIGQSIEQIYRQHEHDQPEQLTSLKELHQTLIDSIDSQVKDEPLPQFDQVIADYENSKNHVVTFDSIEHDRRQAELLARQQAQLAEQAQLARLAQLEQQRQDRLALLASFDKFTLDETGIDELESMDYQALLDLKTEYEEWLQSVDDYAQHSDIEPYLNNYQYYRATVNYLHDSNLIEQKRIESERPIDPLITQRNELDELKHGYVSKISLYTYQTASNAVLEKIKQDMLDRIKLLDNRAEHELLTDKEKSSYGNAHRVINTIDDILSKREPEPVIEPEIVRSDDEVAQPTPDLDHHPEPTAEQQQQAELVKAERLNQLAKIDTASLDPSDLVEMRADLDKYTYSDIKNGQQECEQFIADMQVKAQTEDLTLDELSDYQQAITTVKGIIALHDELEIKRQFEQAIIAQSDPNTKKYYMGYVVKVNEKGAYQQTKDGIVLHTKYANSTSLDTRTHYCFEYDKGKGINNVIAYPYIDTSRFNKPKDLDHDPTKNSGMVK